MVGFVDPTVFKRFLGQALATSKKQATQDCGVTAINTGLCWISCRGEVRSLTFDVLGPVLSLDAQRRQSAIKVLELGKRYIHRRASLSTSDAGPTGEQIETISTIGIDEGIRHVQTNKIMRLKDVTRYIRLVKMSDDKEDMRGI